MYSDKGSVVITCTFIHRFMSIVQRHVKKANTVPKLFKKKVWKHYFSLSFLPFKNS